MNKYQSLCTDLQNELNKDELYAVASDLGLPVNSKSTKRDICGLLANHVTYEKAIDKYGPEMFYHTTLYNLNREFGEDSFPISLANQVVNTSSYYDAMGHNDPSRSNYGSLLSFSVTMILQGISRIYCTTSAMMKLRRCLPY